MTVSIHFSVLWRPATPVLAQIRRVTIWQALLWLAAVNKLRVALTMTALKLLFAQIFNCQIEWLLTWLQ